MSDSLPGFDPAHMDQQPRIVVAYLLGHYGQAMDHASCRPVNEMDFVLVGNLVRQVVDLCEAWMALDEDAFDGWGIGTCRSRAAEYASEHLDALKWLDHLVAANEGRVPS